MKRNIRFISSGPPHRFMFKPKGFRARFKCDAPGLPIRPVRPCGPGSRDSVPNARWTAPSSHLRSSAPWRATASSLRVLLCLGAAHRHRTPNMCQPPSAPSSGSSARAPWHCRPKLAANSARVGAPVVPPRPGSATVPNFHHARSSAITDSNDRPGRAASIADRPARLGIDFDASAVARTAASRFASARSAHSSCPRCAGAACRLKAAQPCPSANPSESARASASSGRRRLAARIDCFQASKSRDIPPPRPLI